jgi:hypothetical protein
MQSWQSTKLLPRLGPRCKHRRKKSGTGLVQRTTVTLRQLWAVLPRDPLISCSFVSLHFSLSSSGNITEKRSLQARFRSSGRDDLALGVELPERTT